MNRNQSYYNQNLNGWNRFYKKGGMYVVSVVILFVFIGMLTSFSPAYRFSSHLISEWTSEIDSSTFLYFFGMENRSFQEAFPKDGQLPELSPAIFQIATSIRLNDPRSLLGNEVPGFSRFDSEIIVAGEGTNYTNLPVESSAPLDEILKDREAVINQSDDTSEVNETNQGGLTTGNRDVVFIYNTHNTESFLPHLPEVKDPDLAHHDTVNITKVSDRLAKALEANGIGTKVNHTNIVGILDKKGWSYADSYKASRNVVEAAISNNKDIRYVIDVHRDGDLPKSETTIEINGKKYARIVFIVGAEYEEYKKNLSLATRLNKLVEQKYPGLSRGVIAKKGPRSNGVYNQDLTDNALLIEFGGVRNNLEELYRTADALAEVFSDFYWDAEKVNANVKGE